jgi:hypothetical protein
LVQLVGAVGALVRGEQIVAQAVVAPARDEPTLHRYDEPQDASLRPYRVANEVAPASQTPVIQQSHRCWRENSLLVFVSYFPSFSYVNFF